jgi:hypothetical protein
MLGRENAVEFYRTSAGRRPFRPHGSTEPQHAPSYLELLPRPLLKEGASSERPRAEHRFDPRVREASRRVQPMSMVWRQPATTRVLEAVINNGRLCSITSLPLKLIDHLR